MGGELIKIFSLAPSVTTKDQTSKNPCATSGAICSNIHWLSSRLFLELNWRHFQDTPPSTFYVLQWKRKRARFLGHQGVTRTLTHPHLWAVTCCYRSTCNHRRWILISVLVVQHQERQQWHHHQGTVAVVWIFLGRKREGGQESTILMETWGFHQFYHHLRHHHLLDFLWPFPLSSPLLLLQKEVEAGLLALVTGSFLPL